MAGNLALCQGEVVDIRNASMNWLPAEVEVSLNSFALARSHLSTGVHFSTWELAARKSGSGYNFNGSIYSKTLSETYKPFSIHPIPLRSNSNDSSASLASFYSYPFIDSEASFSDRAQHEALRNQVNGSFDATEASITASGAFVGSFDDVYVRGPTFYGRYK
ncbi:hypothetical protein P167DRAFT_569693 [Morchella conica CCBAS932]|uniref:Uncharacterized protein n=1 Tax=Morchella conica CCBAS932 TaxID=1392247 RepID=A0A3N4L2W3_9PEZI|nr:hypothetical protein P167DRAFT_569693 [Morchella conica CCBAS932]